MFLVSSISHLFVAIWPIANGEIDAFAAVVSLYVPVGEDDTPFTADPIGTDKSGHTTWRVGIGASSGTLTATESAATSCVFHFSSS